MKKFIIASFVVIVLPLIIADAKNPKTKIDTVVYCTTLDCENCAKKIRENVSFERGVKDLNVDVPTKTVEIQYDPSKTDTLQLRKAINILGYDARVIDYK